jgi:hypothetical protein
LIHVSQLPLSLNLVFGNIPEQLLEVAQQQSPEYLVVTPVVTNLRQPRYLDGVVLHFNCCLFESCNELFLSLNQEEVKGEHHADNNELENDDQEAQVDLCDFLCENRQYGVGVAALSHCYKRVIGFTENADNFINRDRADGFVLAIVIVLITQISKLKLS